MAGGRLSCRTTVPALGSNSFNRRILPVVTQPPKTGPSRMLIGAFGPVGVGIAIAHDPLHRSGHALLTHPAPTLGDNAEPLERIGMTNTNRGKPALDMSSQAAPRQVLLTAAPQDSPPKTAYCLLKRA
jgi:hypothetical protein